MKLEDEAKAYSNAKQRIFMEALEQDVKEVKQFIVDNLWESQEKEETLQCFTEALLWARHAAEKHGIK
jgi:hypothetical protein